MENEPQFIKQGTFIEAFEKQTESINYDTLSEQIKKHYDNSKDLHNSVEYNILELLHNLSISKGDHIHRGCLRALEVLKDNNGQIDEILFYHLKESLKAVVKTEDDEVASQFISHRPYQMSTAIMVGDFRNHKMYRPFLAVMYNYLQKIGRLLEAMKIAETLKMTNEHKELKEIYNTMSSQERDEYRLKEVSPTDLKEITNEFKQFFTELEKYFSTIDINKVLEDEKERLKKELTMAAPYLDINLKNTPK